MANQDQRNHYVNLRQLPSRVIDRETLKAKHGIVRHTEPVTTLMLVSCNMMIKQRTVMFTVQYCMGERVVRLSCGVMH